MAKLENFSFSDVLDNVISGEQPLEELSDEKSDGLRLQIAREVNRRGIFGEPEGFPSANMYANLLEKSFDIALERLDRGQKYSRGTKIPNRAPQLGLGTGTVYRLGSSFEYEHRDETETSASNLTPRDAVRQAWEARQLHSSTPVSSSELPRQIKTTPTSTQPKQSVPSSKHRPPRSRTSSQAPVPVKDTPVSSEPGQSVPPSIFGPLRLDENGTPPIIITPPTPDDSHLTEPLSVSSVKIPPTKTSNHSSSKLQGFASKTVDPKAIHEEPRRPEAPPSRLRNRPSKSSNPSTTHKVFKRDEALSSNVGNSSPKTPGRKTTTETPKKLPSAEAASKLRPQKGTNEIKSSKLDRRRKEEANSAVNSKPAEGSKVAVDVEASLSEGTKVFILFVMLLFLKWLSG